MSGETRQEHTPGPWRVDLANRSPRDGHPIHHAERGLWHYEHAIIRGAATVDAPGGDGIASVWNEHTNVAHCHKDLPTVEANAAIIAAAPDLLAALKASLAKMDEYAMLTDALDDARATARTAIAKAEGS